MSGSASVVKKYEFVAQELRERITKDYGPGHLFPPEVEWAEILGVSVTTVRRGMAMLVKDGLLVRSRGKGTVVLGHDLGHNGGSGAGRPAQKRVLLLPLDPQPFFHELVVAIQQELFLSNHATILHNMTSGKLNEQVANAMDLHEPDGVICGPFYSLNDKIPECLAEAPCPVALVKVSWPAPFNYVAVDLASGVYQSAMHLHDIGCRTIRYLGMTRSTSHWSKVNGMKRYLSEVLHVTAFDEFILPAHGTVKGGYEAACREFGAGRATDGIIAHNDLCALGIMMAAKEFGVSIPGDMALVGIDDIACASQTVPPLTTVAQPKQQIASEVVRILTEASSESGGHVRRQVLLQPAMTLRASTMEFGSRAPAYAGAASGYGPNEAEVDTGAPEPREVCP